MSKRICWNCGLAPHEHGLIPCPPPSIPGAITLKKGESLQCINVKDINPNKGASTMNYETHSIFSRPEIIIAIFSLLFSLFALAYVSGWI